MEANISVVLSGRVAAAQQFEIGDLLRLEQTNDFSTPFIAWHKDGNRFILVL